MKLKNKVAIVTGAASGIGEVTAMLFAQEGAKVVVADVNDEKGRDVVHRIKEEGGEGSSSTRTFPTKVKSGRWLRLW